MAATIQWHDSAIRYGLITRLLHWSMALLFLWQFIGMGLKVSLGRTPLVSFFVSWHAPIGTLLMLLVTLRALWGLYNLRNRPSYGSGLLAKLAVLGHLVIYGLMLIVPALALVRMYGSGRAFAPFGIPLMEAGEKVESLMAPANAVHGLLGWTLLAVIVGHIAMVIVHRKILKDDVLKRMVGR